MDAAGGRHSVSERRPTALIVTGTCGVGKTTTARAWAEARRGAHIAGDDIRWWIRDKAMRHAKEHQQDAIARIACTAAGEFLKLGLDVALDSVWTPGTLRLFQEQLSLLGEVKMVWLMCGADENRERDDGRDPRIRMGDRVDSLLRELLTHRDWPSELRRIDTSDLSVEESLALIEASA